MFGSEIAGAFFHRELLTLPAVVDTVDGRVFNLSMAPLAEQFPLGLQYMETGNYSGVVSGEIDFESMRYVVRFIALGESTNPIKRAAMAQLAHFRALTGEIDYDADGDGETEHYGLEVMASGEWPLTTLQDGKTIYRCLGTFYTVNVSRYGV
jgi:hypothetical protein